MTVGSPSFVVAQASTKWSGGRALGVVDPAQHVPEVREPCDLVEVELVAEQALVEPGEAQAQAEQGEGGHGERRPARAAPDT